MKRKVSVISLTIMALVSMILPTSLVLVLNPDLFHATNPEVLGCHGPLSGLGLCSGLLMAIQMRLALAGSAHSVQVTEQASLCLSDSYSAATSS